MIRILIVDDEISVADALEMILVDSGYQVTIALTGRDGLENINTGWFDIMITDHRLPDMTGLDILSDIQEKGLCRLAIVITAHSTPEIIAESKRLGAYGVLSKPFFPSDVLALIRDGLESKPSGETLPAVTEIGLAADSWLNT